MFDFEKLKVYGASKELNKEIKELQENNKSVDRYLKDQLSRASISIIINIAEGSDKYTKADKRNFYTIARGSVYECVALIDILADEGKIDRNVFERLYKMSEAVSKMLSGLIKSQEKTE